MPVISLVSPKGGVGKSTTANILAAELAREGAQVTIIDADPNEPQVAWAALPGKPDNITVIRDHSEETLIETIDEAARHAPFVIVDVEGTASMLVSDAISRSDLVLIPVQPSHLDAAQAVKAIKLVGQNERRFRVKVPFNIVFTRTNAAFATRDQKFLEQNFTQNDVPILPVHMVERAAFRAVFSYGGVLADLDPRQVSGVEKAMANAHALAAAVIRRLKNLEDQAA